MSKYPAPEVVALAKVMFERKLRAKTVLERAKVNPSTWTRWCSGAAAKTDTLARVRKALEEIVVENDAAITS